MFKQNDLDGLEDYRSFFSYSATDFEYACKYLLDQTDERFSSISVTHKGPKGGDQGVDLKLITKNPKEVVFGQCKLWKERNGGLMDVIRNLKGAMELGSAKKGIIITTVDPSAYEVENAKLIGIEIIGATDLSSLIKSLPNYGKKFDSVMSHRKSLKTLMSNWIFITGFALVILVLLYTNNFF